MYSTAMLEIRLGVESGVESGVGPRVYLIHMKILLFLLKYCLEDRDIIRYRYKKNPG